ncbi:mechanosensitive ion channel [Candidatus Dependentiae bacterium]|nr:mechanosensitive ion channel [Candidatus Dependentiae bacterium]
MNSFQKILLVIMTIGTFAFLSNNQNHNFFMIFFFQLFIAFIITLLIYFMLIGTRKFIKSLCENNHFDTHTCHILQKSAHHFIIFIGIVLILQNLGINLTPIITALGIFSVAISYALKDFISNIIAGLILIAYPHFKINDYIKLKDWQGKVIAINLRYTTLQDKDMTIFIPSFVVYTTTIAIIKPTNQ